MQILAHVTESDAFMRDRDRLTPPSPWVEDMVNSFRWDLENGLPPIGRRTRNGYLLTLRPPDGVDDACFALFYNETTTSVDHLPTYEFGGLARLP